MENANPARSVHRQYDGWVFHIKTVIHVLSICPSGALLRGYFAYVAKLSTNAGNMWETFRASFMPPPKSKLNPRSVPENFSLLHIRIFRVQPRTRDRWALEQVVGSRESPSWRGGGADCGTRGAHRGGLYVGWVILVGQGEGSDPQSLE